MRALFVLWVGLISLQLTIGYRISSVLSHFRPKSRIFVREVDRWAAREEQKKLIDSVVRGDPYEYEYDGEIRTYNPSENVNPFDSGGNAQSTAPFESVPVETEYIASYGLESVITSRGSYATLLPMEYEIAFQKFPGLRQAAIDKVWPDQTSLTTLTKQTINNAVRWTALKAESTQSATESDGSHIMSLFANISTTHTISESELQQLSGHIRQVTDNFTPATAIPTILQLGVNLNSHISTMEGPVEHTEDTGDTDTDSEQVVDSTDATMEYITVVDLHTLSMQFLQHLSPLLRSASLGFKYHTQDVLLRVLRLVVRMLQAGLSSEQKATIYYSDHPTRRRTGEDCLPPAEALELAILHVFGTLEKDGEDEERPTESTFTVTKYEKRSI